MSTMISLFDHTGIMCKPWADAGYQAIAIDIQEPEKRIPGVEYVQLDVLDLDARHIDGVEFIAAFPPCDHLAVSGARWFKRKGLRKLAKSIELFAAAAEFAEQHYCPYMIENPVSTIATYWRKPDYTFHPYEFGGYAGGHDDGYTKKTCLWTGGGFVMPERIPIELAADHDRIHKAAPGPERANIRSATPAGFARAVFEVNAKVTA